MRKRNVYPLHIGGRPLLHVQALRPEPDGSGAVLPPRDEREAREARGGCGRKYNLVGVTEIERSRC